MIKIKNYKAIRKLEYPNPSKVATLLYGFNGVGKSKLTETIIGVYDGNEAALLEPSNLNVNSPGEEIVINLDLFDDGNKNAEIMYFNDDYISQHLFINKKIDTKELFSVIFSPKKIATLKEGFRSSQKELEGITETIKGLVDEMGNLDFIEKMLKVDHSYTETFLKVTKSVTDKKVDKGILDAFWYKQAEENYPKWWQEGYNSYWDSAKTDCIFCDMTIDNSASIFEILMNKSSGKTLDIFKRNDYVEKLNSASVLLGGEHKKAVESLAKIITIASFTDDKDKLADLGAIELKIRDIKLALAKIKQVRSCANEILFEIKEQKIEELPALGENPWTVFNPAIQKKLLSVSNDILKYNKQAKGINGKIGAIRDEFRKMLEEKETLFIDLLKTFNLKYKVELGNLDTAANNVNFTLRIVAEDDKNNRLISNEAPEEVLSYGEVHSIAFIFFLISVYSKLEDNDRVIIIMDDPISSHDAFRKYTTAGVVSKLAATLNPAKHRLILLTHEEGFCRSLFYTVKSFPLLVSNFDFMKFKNKKGECQLEVLQDEDFKIYAKKFVGFIKDPLNNEIAKLVMVRLLLEFDRSFGLDNYTKLNEYLCDILHSRTVNSSNIAEAVNEYTKLKDKYKLVYDLNVHSSHYEQARGQLMVDVKTQDSGGKYILSDLNRFLVSRVVVENYLKNILHLSGKLNVMVGDISNTELKRLVESNISLLNVIVHEDDNTMRPGLDFKDIELVGMEPIDAIYDLLV